MKKELRFPYLTILCILCLFPVTSPTAAAPGGVSSFNRPFPTKQISYSFTLHNTTNRTLRKLDFWTYAPPKRHPIQQCLHLETSHPCRTVIDSLGNQVLHCIFSEIPPYATLVLRISAELSFSDNLNPLPEEDLQPYLSAERFIEADDPEIRRTASLLKQASPIKTAERIFQWVSGHIQDYRYSGEDRGALYALRNGRGDCSEAMYLFIALCRANGIPARGIGGYVCTESTLLDPEDYHNWSEFYANGAWHLADPQRKVFMQGRSQYVALRIIGKAADNPMGDDNRFRYVGDGAEVRMNRPLEM